MTDPTEWQSGCIETEISCSLTRPSSLCSLVFKDGRSETRHVRWPNILASHCPVVNTRGPCGVFPAKIKALVKIASIFWVGVLPQESCIAFEVRALVDVQFHLRRQWQSKEPLGRFYCARYCCVRDAVVLNYREADAGYLRASRTRRQGQSKHTVKEAHIDASVAYMFSKRFPNRRVLALGVFEVSKPQKCGSVSCVDQ